MMSSIDVRECREFILSALLEVAEKTDAEWTPEDIYNALLAGKAFLFMHSFDSESFVVLSQYKHPYLDRTVLVVDVAYSKTGNAIDLHQHELEELAKAAESGYIEFSSPRAGFKRVAEKHGYQNVCTTYRKKL